MARFAGGMNSVAMTGINSQKEIDPDRSLSYDPGAAN